MNDAVCNWRSRAQLNQQLREVWMLLDDIEAGHLSIEEAHVKFKKLEGKAEIK